MGASALGHPAGVSRLHGAAGWLAHKHLPEIHLHSGLSERPLFVPAYGAFRQGIVLSIGVHRRFMDEGVRAEQLHECLAEHYRDSGYVGVLPLAESRAQGHLDPRQLNGTDGLSLALFDNPDSGQVLLTAVFDNLGKGAAGAAVQNLDLMIAGS